MARFASIIGRSVLALLLVAASAWGLLALGYRLDTGAPLRGIAQALWLSAFALALWALVRRRPLLLLPYVAAGIALIAWWSALEPRNDRDWAPDVARTLTARIDGHVAHLADVRNFDWRSDSDATERWEDRTYDLDTIEAVDLINSYWAGPAIAHTLVSFGFADGSHIAFSVEVRRKRGEVYSELSGFFKVNELVVIGADERDIVRVRSNVRGEDVQLFHVKVTPQQAREMFLEVLAEANDLAATPRFYNTLTANCTTVLFRLARRLAPSLPLDWRIVLTGYLPDYAYDHGLLDRDVSLAELRERGRITARARAADASPDFSRLIRIGVPGP
ncbi:Lnb N-terminal periplasmic domain-containing protein [Labrys monachus]|uniref:Lnb N-terminal periplasmic domain-containing protein n=1 Tax=Labrys monachus TaxID=217067 RepID=A0ABU0FCK8_9HYPH|nr:DUF4105 domain-containing protein [Labrys monachus]MDQ0392349.1 hypothetical protein [Labrys monachus]